MSVSAGEDITATVLTLKNIEDNSGNDVEDVQIIINETGLPYNFEDGDLPVGWSFSSGEDFIITSVDGYNSNYSAGTPYHYSGTSEYMYSETYTDLIPTGSEVTISFRWKFDNPSSYTTFQVNGDNKLYSSNYSGSWSYAEYTFTHYGSTQFSWKTQDENVFIDDVRIQWSND